MLYVIWRNIYWTRCIQPYSEISVCREPLEDENIYERRRYVSPFSLYLSFRLLLYSSVSLDHSAVFGETGIASYFPEEHWVNSRSESRDHRACKSKCMSAIFGVGSGRLPLIKGDKRKAQSTRYERFLRQISPSLQRVSFTSQKRNCPEC